MTVSSNRRVCLFACATAAFALLLYVPTLRSQFVYDDYAIILNDTFIHAVSNVLDVISLRVLSRDMMDYNRPVYLISAIVDAAMWGKNPLGHHLSSIVLHAIVCGLFCLLLANVLRNTASGVDLSTRLWVSFGVSALFAAHPLNSETVCCVTYREDLLVAFFTLCGLLLSTYLNSERVAVRWSAVVAVISVGLLAVGSKESGVVFPLILMLYWFFLHRGERRAPWLTVAGAGLVLNTCFLLVASAVRYAGTSDVYWDAPQYVGGSFLKMLTIAPSILLLQLRQTLIPLWLSVDYGMHNLQYYPVLLAVPVLLAAGVYAVRWGRKKPVVQWGFAAFVCAMVPVMNFAPKPQALADRFLYNPLMFLGVVLATVLVRTAAGKTQRGRIVLSIGMVFAVAACSALTVARQAVWRDSVSLWSDTYRKNPTSVLAANNLGYAHYDQQNFALAAKWFHRAIQLSNGTRADPQAGFALVLAQKGMIEQAREALRRACALDEHYCSPDRLQRSLRLSRAQADELREILRQPASVTAPD